MKSTQDTVTTGGKTVTMMYNDHNECRFSVQLDGRVVTAELKSVIDTCTADGALMYYLRFMGSDGEPMKTNSRDKTASSWIAACLRDTFLAGGIYTSTVEPLLNKLAAIERGRIA